MTEQMEEGAGKFGEEYTDRNYKITDFQCALGISQLKKLDKFIERRQYLFDLYNKLFSEVSFIELPIIKEKIKPAWHLYTILLKNIDRDKFFKYMRNNNIGVNVHYIPIYHFSYYQKHFNFNPKDFPVTEEVFKKIITLPLFPKMKDKEIEYISDIIKNYR